MRPHIAAASPPQEGFAKAKSKRAAKPEASFFYYALFYRKKQARTELSAEFGQKMLFCINLNTIYGKNDY